MARTAAPVTPGTNPAADEVLAEAGEALAQEGVKAVVAASEADALRAEMAEMRKTMAILARNQANSAPAAKVELPTMAEVMKKPPSMPVLTAEGWFVPSVHPTDRISKG